MSEYSRDEEELQAFLSGKSAMSRRYKEAGAEEPPAHVDAAIMAASRWAVGADRKAGADRKSRADEEPYRKTGDAASRRGAAHWRSNFATRWSIPLATAAVVVIAATLTLMIERDPEIDRIRDRYDAASRDVSPAEQPMVAEQAPEPVAEQPAASAPAPVSEVPAASAPAPGPAQDELVKKESGKTGTPEKQVAAKSAAPAKPAPASDQQREVVEEKINEMRDEDRAASSVVARQAPEPKPQAERAASPATAQEPARAFADNAASVNRSESDTEGTVANVGDAADDESGLAGANMPAETEQAMQMDAPAPGRVQSFATTPDTARQITGELSESAPPAEPTAAPAVRDPEQWIEDIEDLLAQGRRADAIDSLKTFRQQYPDYELAPRLRALLPAGTD